MILFDLSSGIHGVFIFSPLSNLHRVTSQTAKTLGKICPNVNKIFPCKIRLI